MRAGLNRRCRFRLADHPSAFLVRARRGHHRLEVLGLGAGRRWVPGASQAPILIPPSAIPSSCWLPFPSAPEGEMRCSSGAGPQNSAATWHRAALAEIGTCGSVVAALMRTWNSVSAVAAHNVSWLSQWAALTGWNRVCDERAVQPGIQEAGLGGHQRGTLAALRDEHGKVFGRTLKTLISVAGELVAGWLSWFMRKASDRRDRPGWVVFTCRRGQSPAASLGSAGSSRAGAWPWRWRRRGFGSPSPPGPRPRTAGRAAGGSAGAAWPR